MPQVCSIAAQAPPTPYVKMPATAKSSFPRIRDSGSLCFVLPGWVWGILQHYHRRSSHTLMMLMGLRWRTGVQLCPAAPGQSAGTARGGVGAAQDPVSPFRRSSKMVRGVKWKNSSATSSLDMKNRELKPPAALVKMQQEPEGCFLLRSCLCTMPVPLEGMSSDVARVKFVSFRHGRASACTEPEPKALSAEDANDGCRLLQPCPSAAPGLQPV